MKNFVLVILSAATVALATVCLVQTRHAAQQQAQVTEQRRALEETNKALVALQQVQEQAEQRRRELLRQSDQLVAQAKAQQTAVSNRLAAKLAKASANGEAATPDKEAPDIGSFFSKMMQDPETKKLIQETQRTMMEQMYAPLIKKLGLTPEEADKFKELLADHTMKATEQATSMFGDAGATNRADITSQMTDMQKSFDDQLKAFLGDDRFAQYQEYQKTAGERTLLNQFKQQLGDTTPLTDQQGEQLLALMNEEQQKVAAATGQPMPGAGDNAAKFDIMLSDEKWQEFLDNQTLVNQRVYDRAKEVLSPDQLAAFGTFQTNTARMIKMSMGMARQMFKSPDNTQPASSQ